MADAEPLTLDVSEWLNGPPVDLADLRGRVVMIETFQMLCPGCISHGLPQAVRAQRTFAAEQFSVIGLHTVFEHHDVMGPRALEVFLSEYGIRFPVGIDRPSEHGMIPETMGRLSLQGTPSTLLLDRNGILRHSFFGALDDLVLGAHIGRLLAEPTGQP